jgi:dolichol-phosphate mannosyltransferase
MTNNCTNHPRVSIVVPTLNEAENIDPLLHRLFVTTACERFDAELIIVDDGSIDGTRERAKAWMQDHPVRLLAREPDGGLAGAVLAGARETRGEVVVVMDADLSHPPDRVPDLVDPVLDNEADMVVGSRWTAGGMTPDWPWHRRLMSRLASWLAWPLVDVRDPMSGFFAVRREHLLQAAPEASGYKIGLEVIVAGGESLRVIEVPIEFTDRKHGQSKLGTEPIFAYLDRLRSLAGGAVSTRTSLRFALVGLMGMAIDITCFQVMIHVGFTLAAAHIMGFVAATLFNCGLNAHWSFGRSARMSHEAGWHRYIRFLLVALLALLLRGALLGTLVQINGWPPQLAIIAAVGAAAVVNYFGSAFFVFPLRDDESDPTMRWCVASVGVIAYLVLLRLFYLGLPNLLVEEAYYWNYAQHPALSYLDHPPMVAWLIWLGTAILGNNEIGVRAGAFICWFITGYFAYRTSVDLFDKSVAFRAVLLVAVLPIFFFTGFFMTPDAPLMACWAGAVYFFQRALLKQSRRAWWGVGVCLGFGLLSKYTIALLGPSALIYILSDRQSRRWLVRPEPYVAALCALCLFTPVLIWNAREEWASFAFQTVGRLNTTPEFGLHLLAAALLLLLTPIGLGNAILSFLPKAWSEPCLNGTVDENIQSASVDRRRLFSMIFTLVPLSVFIAFSLRHDPKLNWAGPLWLSAIPPLARDMIPYGAVQRVGLQAWCKRLWAPTILSTMLIYGVAFHYVTLGFPGFPYPNSFKLVGWKELGKQIEAIEDDVESRTGEEPLVVGMDKYNISSQLSFYRTIAEDKPREGVLTTVGRHLFGENSLMYERWFNAKRGVGKTVIMVDDHTDTLSRPSITDSFERLDPIQPIVIRSDSGIKRTFFYRVGYGYRGQKTT